MFALASCAAAKRDGKERLASGAWTISKLYVGPADTLAPCHWDGLDNCFVQLQGRKNILLFPPDTKGLRPFPADHPYDSRAQANIERLQRQLTELECLEAMYPREGSGSGFRSLNPDALDAARAAVDGWERSGEPPGADALAAIPPLRCSLTLDLEEDAETSRPAETLTLRVTLPRRYPAVAPTIEAAGSATSRDAAGAILSRLDRIAEERTTALGEEGGAECLAELAQEARELAEADANATRRAAAAAASERDARDAPNALHHAVVRIDHMNDSSGYVKKLRKWAAALGLAVRLFYAEEGRGATATATATATAPADEDDSDDRPPSGGRVEGVFVVLAGEDDAIGGFLARLRTEMVDVDSRGAKCRERKSEVLCRRRDQSRQKLMTKSLETVQQQEPLAHTRTRAAAQDCAQRQVQDHAVFEAASFRHNDRRLRPEN